MGPVLASSANKSKFDVSVLEGSFKHPSAWSGMRFCGLSEQQNVFIPRVGLSLAQQKKLSVLILQMNLQAGFVKNAR